VNIALESTWNSGPLDSRPAGTSSVETLKRSSIMSLWRKMHLFPKIMALTAMVLMQVATAQAAPKCAPGTVPLDVKCGIPVTTEFFFDSAFTITDDNGGPYPHGVNGVTSGLLDSGINGLKHDWRFDTRGSSVRRITETVAPADRIENPNDPHWSPYTNDPSWWPATSVVSRGFLNVQCTFVGVDMLTMGAGEARTCPLLNSFLYTGADSWALNAHKSFWQSPPEITDVQVTCNSVDADGCKDWSITPILDPVIGMQAVGRLVHDKVTGRNGKVTKEMDGNFYMRFHIHVTRP
jgi:hypothetical protein